MSAKSGKYKYQECVYMYKYLCRAPHRRKHMGGKLLQEATAVALALHYRSVLNFREVRRVKEHRQIPVLEGKIP